MMMKNDRGMTLVEVLAALVILGIVFIGFMTIFPQMSLFNAKTEDKLKTMNLAKQELNNWNGSTYSLSDFEEYPEVPIDSQTVRRFEGKTPNSEIDFYEGGDLEDNAHEDSVALHKIHIKIKKEDKIISETFGYIKVK